MAARASVLLDGRVLTYGAMVAALREQHPDTYQEIMRSRKMPQVDEARELEIEEASRIVGWLRGRGVDCEIRR